MGFVSFQNPARSIAESFGSVKDGLNYDGLAVLVDFSSTGRERRWAKYKAGSEGLAQLYHAANEVEMLITDKRLLDLEHCGEFLEFVVFADGSKRLKYAYFCRNRLCPMCQWRRSLKLSFRLRGAIERLKESDNSFAYIFATFTVKNCTGGDLGACIGDMTKAFSSMLRCPTFKGKILGYCRTIEVTVNQRDLTYHPHIHALLVVEKSYFSRGYVRHSAWQQAWAAVMDLDYLPQVNVKRADVGSVVEVAKYSTKGVDSLANVGSSKLAVGIGVLVTLHKALKKRRLISAGGVLKAALHDFDRDLIRDDEGVVEDVDSPEVGRVIYKWTPKFGVYLEA